MGNYSLRDYGTFAGVTAVCAPYGYYVGGCPNIDRLHTSASLSGRKASLMWAAALSASGSPANMRMPSMWCGLTLGAMAGFMLAYQQSSGVC